MISSKDMIMICDIRYDLLIAESTAYPSSFEYREALQCLRPHPEWGSYANMLLSKGELLYLCCAVTMMMMVMMMMMMMMMMMVSYAV
jgi:hypothetical protein